MNLIYKEFSKPVSKLKHFILNMNGKPGKGNWGNVSDLHMQFAHLDFDQVSMFALNDGSNFQLTNALGFCLCRRKV